ncbi:hypothetical protein Poly51_45040 [Rubripirellula tenax]|uniref:Endonuclease/Exonuclease/phosphatase family protein n=1 Tax=Rubripirellula tenax TaxID=2528015 RepID=A0A5C6EFN9_9BACT|nr:hypothetical protein [Rubripirellula tenax]TWU48603.1 hypothetical protein Poly51_45040 [Rubripirellula tenax]
MTGIFGSMRRRRRSRISSVSIDVPLVRWLGPIATVVTIVVLAGFLMSGRINLSSLDGIGSSDALAADSKVDLTPVGFGDNGKSNETIRVATIALEGFADATLVAPEQIRLLARILAQFDVVAVQGIDGGDATPIRDAVEKMTASGGDYGVNISKPVGRRGQFQSYAFVWDKSRIAAVPDSIGVVNDEADRMLFEPMYGSFETRIGFTDGRRPLRFTLINARAIPPSRDRPSGELAVLDDVFVSVRNFTYETQGDEDCIMVGDLGVGPGRLGELGMIPGVESIVNREGLRQHILLDPKFTAEFTGRSGTFDFAAQFGVSPEAAMLVTRQMPMWIELAADEAPR